GLDDLGFDGGLDYCIDVDVEGHGARTRPLDTSLVMDRRADRTAAAGPAPALRARRARERRQLHCLRRLIVATIPRPRAILRNFPKLIDCASLHIKSAGRGTLRSRDSVGSFSLRPVESRALL